MASSVGKETVLRTCDDDELDGVFVDSLDRSAEILTAEVLDVSDNEVCTEGREIGCAVVSLN